MESNEERAARVADVLVAGSTLALRDPGDVAAQVRMKKILDAPPEALARLRALVEDPLRRLYRQRNLVCTRARQTRLRSAPPSELPRRSSALP